MTGHKRVVTKSVRLSPEESELLAHVSAREHLAEGPLLRKWVLEALERTRLGQAIADYMAGEINLGEAAARGGVGLPRLLAELDSRGIDAISPAHFRASLGTLTELFGASPELREVIAKRQTGRAAGESSDGGRADDERA